MKRYAATFKQLRSGLFPLSVVLVLTFGSLVLLSQSIEDSAQFTRLYSTLFFINVAIMVMLIVLIGINVARVLRQYRRGTTGSRLTVRLIVIFTALSLLPVSVVFYVAYGFINRGIDHWFDVRVEKALESSLDLSRGAFDVRLSELSQLTQRMADEIARADTTELGAVLNRLRARHGASEVSLHMTSGQLVAYSNADPSKLLPDPPDIAALALSNGMRSQVSLEPQSVAGTMHARVLIALPPEYGLSDARVLQVLFPISDRMNALAGEVQGAYAEYQKLTYQREPLKFSFTLTLALVLLLSVLAAVWAAFVSAQRLVDPIRVLTLGTRAVAEGNYDKRLTPQSHDELGVLVESFNDMTQRIAQARDDAQRSQALAESERAYLKAVLGSLSSGVLTFDHAQQLRTANAAAAQLLGVDVVTLAGANLEMLAQQHQALDAFARTVQARLAGNDAHWQDEIVVVGPQGRKVLLCRGHSLPGVADAADGYVVVFDDVTALIQAERDAAWREVARRIAHEIKNPLTPIQLAAERLRHKYLGVLYPAGAEILDRSTHTIIAQVDTLKQMVNAFSEYARMPRMEIVPVQLNALVNEVMDLYRIGEHELSFEAELDPNIGVVEADTSRLRQVLHNLIKNAMEALRGMTDIRIKVSTRLIDDGAAVEMAVEDNGPGIPPELLANLFEPYVTTKPKGAGLGLAIVKKIVDEHGGAIAAMNRPEGGVAIRIRMPCSPAAKLAEPRNLRQAV